MRLCACCVIGVLAFLTPARADVVKLDVQERVDVLEGRTFGDAGAYEKLRGVIHFAWDPKAEANQRVVDIDLAQTDDAGLVTASATFMVLQPKDPAKRSGVGLLEVSNRGGKASLAYFNGARSSRNPSEERDFGDGYLLEQGLTIIWVGWQWDVPQRPDLLRIRVPAASEDGETIYGYARADWVTDQPLASLPLGHRGHEAYPVARPADEGNVLTVRDGRDEPRRVIDRDTWRFERKTAQGAAPSPTWITMDQPTAAGKIYELVYHTKRPRVVGLGLAAVRDTIAYAKHDESCPFGIDVGVAFGVSQTGRFLRHFIYQGFNSDEDGQIAFDGMLVHTAGAGRGSFNHRFAQPSRDAHRYSAFLYPTDVFPFTDEPVTDEETGITDGLFAHTPAEHLPRIFYTNTGYEYWGRAASLIHTTPDGTADVEPPDNVRVYHLASAQHVPGGNIARGRPMSDGVLAYFNSSLDFRSVQRALLERLIDWTANDVAPPPSRYPRISEGTLVPIESLQFPEIVGIKSPAVAHTAYRVDYGPRWAEGIIDKQPPDVGEPFVVLVPQVDEYGNELGGVRTLETRVPLATYTPWSLRAPIPPADELRDFYGMVCPLPRVERGEDARDSRPPVEALYGSKDEFLDMARQAVDDMIQEGFLLERDVPIVLDRAAAMWDWVIGR